MPNFTIIDHDHRKEMGLNLTEYCVLDLLNNLPKARQSYVAESLGIARKTVIRIIKKSKKEGILTVNYGKYTVQNWSKKGQNVPKNFSSDGTKCPTKRDKMSHPEGQNVPAKGTKCPTKRDKMSHYNNTSINTSINNKYNNNANRPADAGRRSLSGPEKCDPELQKIFDKLWRLYPRQIGEAQAYECFKTAYEKNSDIVPALLQSIKNYVRYIKHFNVEEKYIKFGSSFFEYENWKDWQKYKIQIEPANAFENQYEMRGDF